jgi:hypothetical protein
MFESCRVHFISSIKQTTREFCKTNKRQVVFIFLIFFLFDTPYLIIEMLDFEEKTLRNKSKVKSQK